MGTSKDSPHTRHAAPAVYEQIIDSLASGVLALDKDGCVLVANAAACSHLGLPCGAIKRGAFVDELPLPPAFLLKLHTVLNEHRPLEREEVAVPRESGEKKELGFSASLLEGPEPFNGAVFLFVDMTERRALERAAELNQQLAQIGQLTAGVVHELRSPLSVIGGMAELLERKLEDDSPYRKRVETILQETQNMGRSISQFLGFARPFDLEMTPCEARQAADRARALCETAAREKGVTFEVEEQGELPLMRADPRKLAQAVSNVAGNAIDAVAEGGRVTIVISRQGADIQYDILDDGPGIHLNPGEDLFKPFFSKKEGGTGLGLAICHRIVTAHSGSITHANRDQGGARFRIRVPIEKGAL
ncbi:MAG: PAS domain-containing protein [Nitrospiraceae bacterium]|nr:PAS domain-containing protein [Nitrospiraceae bacterium]